MSDAPLRPDAPEPAQARPAAPLDDAAYTLTIEDAANAYAAAGFPRPARRLQKYCARGDLDCRKVETSFGERYLITRESVARHIEYIKQTASMARQEGERPDAPEPAQARPAAPERIVALSEAAMAEEAAPEPAQARPAAPDYQTRYVDHLEKENAFLREQNTVLLERVKETNILTGRLQEMLTPLLGRPAERDSTGEAYPRP